MQKLHLVRRFILLPLATMFTTVGLLTGQADAGRIFTIDTFTSDTLTIKLAEDPTTGLAPRTDGLPTGTSPDLYFIATDESQKNDWILQSAATTISASGSIGGIAVNEQSFFYNNDIFAGDALRASFSAGLNVGDVVTEALTFTWSGTNLFDPDAVDSITLTWGTSNIGAIHPWGAFQSSTSTATVPEPSTAIAMGLLGIIGFAGNRRHRRQVSVA